MMQDGVEVMILPDGAKCLADEEQRCPLDFYDCPTGCDECSGECEFYTESYDEEKSEVKEDEV